MKTLKEMREESEKCLRCGLCQVVCPIYNVLGSEPAVARAKVRLTRELAGGNLKVTPRMKKIMSLCLNCKACVANCPSQVHTDKLVLAARAQIKDEDGLPFLLGAALKQFCRATICRAWPPRHLTCIKTSGCSRRCAAAA